MKRRGSNMEREFEGSGRRHPEEWEEPFGRMYGDDDDDGLDDQEDEELEDDEEDEYEEEDEDGDQGAPSAARLPGPQRLEQGTRRRVRLKAQKRLCAPRDDQRADDGHDLHVADRQKGHHHRHGQRCHREPHSGHRCAACLCPDQAETGDGDKGKKANPQNRHPEF